MLTSSLSHVEMNEYVHHVPLDCPLYPWMLEWMTSVLKEVVICKHRRYSEWVYLNLFIWVITIIILRNIIYFYKQCLEVMREFSPDSLLLFITIAWHLFIRILIRPIFWCLSFCGNFRSWNFFIAASVT